MFEFQSTGYVILALMGLVAITILYLLIRRIKNKSLKNEIKNFKLRGIIEIVVGIIFILISIFWFLSIQVDIDRAAPIFQPVAKMTSEPIKFLAIGLFLAGVIFLITGSYSFLQSRNALSGKSNEN